MHLIFEKFVDWLCRSLRKFSLCFFFKLLIVARQKRLTIESFSKKKSFDIVNNITELKLQKPGWRNFRTRNPKEEN